MTNPAINGGNRLVDITMKILSAPLGVSSSVGNKTRPIRPIITAANSEMTHQVVAIRRALRQVQPGLSPYAYRHARASDAKATQGRAGVAAWLGHSNDRTQQGYGHARSSRGAVAIKAAKASRPVRLTKTLPPTLAQRFAKVAARLAVRTSSQPASNAPTRQRSPRPRW